MLLEDRHSRVKVGVTLKGWMGYVASTNAQRRQPAMAAKMDALLDQHYIGGALVPPAQGRYLDVIDPSEERVWGRSAAGTAEVYETPNAPVVGPRACGARTRACVAVC